MLYVEVFVNKGQPKIWSILLVLAGLWVPAFVNLTGLKNMDFFQRLTTITKFAALVFMSVVGLFYIKSANFSPFNVSGHSAISAIGSGMAIALFSYVRVETASVAAKNVRNAKRNVPRATLLGTAATAVVYMLSLIAVFGIVPDKTLQTSTAPFSTVNHMFGGTVWGNVMAAVVIISGIGALNSWTMVTAEMPRAAAQDGLFPKRFADLNGRGMPAFGIIVSTVLASIAIVINYLGANGETVFTSLVLMTGITVAIPYGFSAAAQIKWQIADKHQIEKARLVRDMIVAVLSLVFSILFIYFSRDTGHSFWVYWSPYFLTLAALLLGIPVYQRERKRMKDPGEVPPVPESDRVGATGRG